MEAERTNFFDEGIENVKAEFEKLQKRFEKGRLEVEKRTEKELKRLRKTPLAKRVDAMRDDASKQFDSNVENFLKLLPIASQANVKRLERKVNALSKKVTALERAKSDGAAKAAPKAAAKMSA